MHLNLQIFEVVVGKNKRKQTKCEAVVCGINRLKTHIKRQEFILCFNDFPLYNSSSSTSLTMRYVQEKPDIFFYPRLLNLIS